MTTNVAIPFIDLVADGAIDTFTFEFPIVENFDLIVLVDNNDGEGLRELSEFSEYTIVNLTDEGGEVLFALPPIDNARVLIVRRTTISQNIDYLLFSSFPAETHEFQLDKITYILQELLGGPLGPLFLTFDLAAVPDLSTITITNTGGTDALIPSWVSQETAGAFHGEVTLNAPADESFADKPDGYVYYEYETP